MKTQSIRDLERFERERNADSNGYKIKEVSISTARMKEVAHVGGYVNSFFEFYIKEAIRELEVEILKKAFELEEDSYQKTLLEAKKESANILAGQDITN